MNEPVTMAWLVMLEPVTLAGTECPDCLFDTVLTFPVRAISYTGVRDMPPLRACWRCYDDGPDAVVC